MLHPRTMTKPQKAVFGLLAICFGSFASMIMAEQSSTGCGQDGLESGLHTYMDGGIARPYTLRLPPRYAPDTPTPIIFAFHGWGGDETSFLGVRAVRRLADRLGYIVVAPRGLGAAESDRSYASWTFPGSATGLDGDGANLSVPGDTPLTCDPAAIEDYSYPSYGPVGVGTAQSLCSWTQCQTDDIAFVANLVTEIEENLCVDQDRIFAVGSSNGGMFVWGLGQDSRTARIFRAMSALIGLPHRGYLDGPARPDGLPMLVITGQSDPTVPSSDWEDARFTTSSDGAEYYYTGATAITRAWAESKGCSTATEAAIVDVGSNRFDCRSYCRADVGAEFPAVLDCRMNKAHDADLRRTWPLVLDFFANQ